MDLTWRIELSKAAQRQLKKLDRSAVLRIERFLQERVVSHPRPQDLASPLAGRSLGLWKFRVGDYRLICDIQIETVTILGLAIGHRRDIYH